MMLRYILAALALIAAPATAATGDALPPQPVGHSETFSGTVADLEARYRLGISPWTGTILTRMHVASGEREIWTGKGFLGPSVSQPLYVKNGVLRINTRPLPPAAIAVAAQKADKLLAEGKLTAKWAANVKAARWSSGLLQNPDASGYGYYEADWQLTSVPGRWQAFYLGDWNTTIEVDIIEQVERDKRCFQSTTHAPGGAVPKGGTARICLPFALDKGFHKIGGLVAADKVTIYVDGIERAQIAMPPSKVPPQFHWIIHEAVGGHWLENPAYGVNNLPNPYSSSTTWVNGTRWP